MADNEEPRIGVYVCHCGTNIAGVVDVKAVAEFAKQLPNVALSVDYVFMCSAPGQEMIQNDIKKHNLNRIVVAACSPRMHEPTFQAAILQVGLNQFLFEMANIREHCSWVHPTEPEVATQKSKELVRMAVAKARLLEPIELEDAPVVARVLVIGGGVAGLTAASDAASAGHAVTLVESSPTLGGNAARVGKLAHSEQTGADVAVQLIRKVVSNENIQIFTDSDITEFTGSIGNYTATITTRPRHVSGACTSCDKCVDVCPIEAPNEYEYGLNTRKAIFKPYDGAHPAYYVIDVETCDKCGKCVEVCEVNAIDLKEEAMNVEIKFGTTIVASGFDAYLPYDGEYGFKKSSKVITLNQLERLLDDKGPTNGKLVMNGKTPETVTFISCVGSMEPPSEDRDTVPYCSRMCCSAAFKSMLQIKDKNPDTHIFGLFKDIRTYARRDERMYEEASKEEILFIRWTNESRPTVKTEKDSVAVTVFDAMLQEDLLIPTDLLVLCVGMRPTANADELSEMLKLCKGADGFIQEAHAKLRPVETPTAGILVAGAAQAPRDIIESTTSGSAAASKAIMPLIAGKVKLEALQAIVDEDVCGGCGICEPVCPYGAISYKDRDEGSRLAEVNSSLCIGCGTCVAACPSGALQQRGFTDLQIEAMIQSM